MAEKRLKSKVMAVFTLNGHIESIKYTESSVFVFVSEVCNGYRDGSGRIVDNEVLVWRVLFPNGMRSYISKYFAKGMLVNIYGTPRPYAKDHDGNMVDGYTILGKNIDRAAYQRTSTRIEKKMIRDSQLNSDEQPDLDAYNKPDF
jgi:hypothetical protein